MVELEYTTDSKSVASRHGGSSPSRSTIPLKGVVSMKFIFERPDDRRYYYNDNPIDVPGLPANYEICASGIHKYFNNVSKKIEVEIRFDKPRYYKTYYISYITNPDLGGVAIFDSNDRLCYEEIDINLVTLIKNHTYKDGGYNPFWFTIRNL